MIPETDTTVTTLTNIHPETSHSGRFKHSNQFLFIFNRPFFSALYLCWVKMALAKCKLLEDFWSKTYHRQDAVPTNSAEALKGKTMLCEKITSLKKGGENVLPAGSLQEPPFCSTKVNSRSQSFANKQYGATSMSSAFSPGQRWVNVTWRSMFGWSTRLCCTLANWDELTADCWM